jgi:hypothetical protein
MLQRKSELLPNIHSLGFLVLLAVPLRPTIGSLTGSPPVIENCPVRRTTVNTFPFLNTWAFYAPEVFFVRFLGSRSGASLFCCLLAQNRAVRLLALPLLR